MIFLGLPYTFAADSFLMVFYPGLCRRMLFERSYKAENSTRNMILNVSLPAQHDESAALVESRCRILSTKPSRTRGWPLASSKYVSHQIELMLLEGQAFSCVNF